VKCFKRNSTKSIRAKSSDAGLWESVIAPEWWTVDLMLIADPVEEVERNGDGCVGGRSSLEACCCVDVGLLSAHLNSVVEFPFVAAMCKERLNCYVSSAILPLNLLYPCL